jgi:hypothetical protein
MRALNFNLPSKTSVLLRALAFLSCLCFSLAADPRSMEIDFKLSTAGEKIMDHIGRALFDRLSQNS